MYYSANYHLLSSSSIITEIFEGVFFKYDDGDTTFDDIEVTKKPFKLLIISKDNEMLSHSLLSGELDENEYQELLKQFE